MPVEIVGVRALALSPADQFLHVCGHGVAWNHVPPLRWIADAAAVVRASGETMDWERVRERAAHHGLGLALAAALRVLDDVAGLRPPDGVRRSIEQMSVSFGERIEFEASINPLGLASWLARARMAGRAVGRSRWGHKLEAAGEVLRFITRTDRLSATPGLLVRKVIWRVRRTANVVAGGTGSASAR